MNIFIQDKTAFDTSSISHFVLPLAIGYFLQERWKWFVPLLIVFELFENLSKITIKIGAWFILSPETLTNSFTDVALGIAGLYIGFLIYKKMHKKN